MAPLERTTIEHTCATSQTTHSFDEITTSNAKNSPLLRLPGELRDEVYKHVFSGYKFQAPGLPSIFRTCPHMLSLLSVCRQTHHEARTLIFSLSTFSITAPLDPPLPENLYWQKTPFFFISEHNRELVTSFCIETFVYRHWLCDDGFEPISAASLSFLKRSNGRIVVVAFGAVARQDDRDELERMIRGWVPDAEITYRRERSVFYRPSDWDSSISDR